MVTFHRRRKPTPLPVLNTTTPTRWGWGLFAGTIVVALIAAGAWLDGSELDAAQATAEQAAYVGGLLEGKRRTLQDTYEEVLGAYHAGYAAGHAAGAADAASAAPGANTACRCGSRAHLASLTGSTR